MKTIKWLIALVLLAAGGVGTAWADHHGGHVHFGVVIGPYWGPWYYPPPPYYYPPYYPPVVIERPTPQVYVEQPPAAAAPAVPAAPAAANYWYYCAKAKGYYPYVKECPSGWQRVPAQPPQP
ncbi:MAG TPA: hypothetical protein VMB75_00475 [Rhodocyclaceae bacterium]|nr:hypothetical protein [Rhodocyclaceae bacterium]